MQVFGNVGTITKEHSQAYTAENAYAWLDLPTFGVWVMEETRYRVAHSESKAASSTTPQGKTRASGVEEASSETHETLTMTDSANLTEADPLDWLADLRLQLVSADLDIQFSHRLTCTYSPRSCHMTCIDSKSMTPHLTSPRRFGTVLGRLSTI